MESTSFLQAVASLLVVIGLILLTAWVLKRFSIGGLSSNTFKPKADKRLKLVETLWLDARYRLVLVEDGVKSYTIMLGPQQALQLTEKPNPSQSNRHAPPSDFLAS